MTEAMKALDEIDGLAAEIKTLVKLGPLTQFEHEELRLAVNGMTSLLPTLRAALAPPADGEVEAIAARLSAAMNDTRTPFQLLADADKLLRLLAAERERRVEVEAKLENAYAAIHRQIDEIHPVRVTDEQIATLTKD